MVSKTIRVFLASFSVVTVALAWSNGAPSSRRRILGNSLAASGVVFSSGFSNNLRPPTASAAEEVAMVVPKDKAVLVLGSNGMTGKECVKACLAKGRPCIASSRSGSFNEEISSSLLSTATVDVTSPESIQAAVSTNKNIGALIFAASASAGKTRDIAFGVDKDGVINAAKCCLANNIPRLVIVSSGTVTRPDAAVYKLLNFVGSGIMEAKMQGEDEVRELYAASEVRSAGLGYTIVRPGGLTLDAPLGAAEMELHQGDSKSGRVARADVGKLCVESLDYASTFDVTYECYAKSTAKPIESVGLSNILKMNDPTNVKTGFERQGSNYEELFTGLVPDAELKA